MLTIDKGSRIISTSQLTFLYSTPPIRVRVLENLTRYSLRPHYNDHPQLWYCRKGECTCETEHGTCLCREGSLLTIPPGVVHTLHTPESQKVTLVQLCLTYNYPSGTDFDVFPNTTALLFLPGFLRSAGIGIPEHYPLSPASRAAAEALLDCLISGQLEEPAKRDLLERLLSLPELALPGNSLEAAAQTARAKLYPTLRALEYLHQNYPRRITAQQLCQVTSLCRTNLFRLIRQYLGVSYSAYLTMLRIVHANCALVHTNYSIAYISDMCGFSHSSHMSSCYKRYKGILPKDDRQKQLIYQRRYGKLHITHEFFMDDFFG